MKKISIFALLALAALGLFGCADAEDSDLPWAKPASWEGTPAGMGNIKGQGGAPKY